MKLTGRELKNLPVVTKSGERIGTLKDLVIDVATHSVFNYQVLRKRTLAHLLPETFLITPTQVISLDNTKMVVDDTSVLLEATMTNLLKQPQPSQAFSLSKK